MNAFDNGTMDAYKAEVKEKWGGTEAYAEFARKTKDYPEDRFAGIHSGLENIFREFAELMQSKAAPDSVEAQALVKKLQAYITEHYYTCTAEILTGLGQMYTADERFRKHIDENGDGTAAFVCKAIEAH